jgi:hypothetical protein
LVPADPAEPPTPVDPAEPPAPGAGSFFESLAPESRLSSAGKSGRLFEQSRQRVRSPAAVKLGRNLLFIQ